MFLRSIFIYPVKSLAGIELKSSKFEERGLNFDRRLMIVDKNNAFITQRQITKMSTIKTQIDQEKSNLILEFDSKKINLHLNLDKTELSNKSLNENSVSFNSKAEIQGILNTNKLEVKVWDSICSAIEIDKDTSLMLSNFLQVDCKLVLMPNSTNRRVSEKYDITKNGVVSFADGYPFLLTNKASLDDLNKKSTSFIPMDRFRTNFVIEGNKPFEEDNWKKIKIGKYIFYVVKPCERCVVTTIDQGQGKSFDKEPLKTLSTYRKIDGKVIFGQNLIPESSGHLEVGDKVEILN